MFADPGRSSGGQTRGRQAPLGGRGGQTCGQRAFKARLNFNLKFDLRLAAVKPAVKLRTFRGPTTGCTPTRRGPGRNITWTLRTPRTADKAAVEADRPRAAGGLNFAVGPRAGKNRPRARRKWPRGQGADPKRSSRGPDAE